MIILQGKLRQSSDYEYEGNKSRKIWVEHSIENAKGADDLRIEQFYLPEDTVLPTPNSDIKISVKPYVSGKSVKFQGVALVK